MSVLDSSYVERLGDAFFKEHPVFVDAFLKRMHESFIRECSELDYDLFGSVEVCDEKI
jgi:hypothetical protein